MSASDRELLQKKVQRNSGAVITLALGEDVRHIKSRFLGGDDSGFWLECPANLSPQCRRQLESHQRIGLSFRQDEGRLVCVVVPQKLDRAFALAGGGRTCAVRVAMPDDVKRIQRRSSYRVRALAEPLELQLWRVQAGSPAIELPHAQLRDIGAGGAGLLIRRPSGVNTPPLKPGDSLAILLKWNDLQLPLTGAAQFVRPAGEGNWRCGVRFGNPGDSPRARQLVMQLNRLLAELQRREARRVWRVLTGRA